MIEKERRVDTAKAQREQRVCHLHACGFVQLVPYFGALTFLLCKMELIIWRASKNQQAGKDLKGCSLTTKDLTHTRGL